MRLEEIWEILSKGNEFLYKKKQGIKKRKRKRGGGARKKSGKIHVVSSMSHDYKILMSVAD